MKELKIPARVPSVKAPADHTVAGEIKRGRKTRTLSKDEEGRYANYFQIGHNAFEFLLEFGQQEGKIHTRIYVSPPHARMLRDLLSDSLAQHARIFGGTPDAKK